MKNKSPRNPSISIWAKWVVESDAFQNFVLATLFLNSIILGIQAEIEEEDRNAGLAWQAFVLILDILDTFAMLVFLAEILIKWTDDFIAFWQEDWNIFDFVITFFSLVNEVIKYIAPMNDNKQPSDLMIVAENLRSFRVFRSLKIIARFKQSRIIVASVVMAARELLFIAVLALVFIFIFAVFGVTFFDYNLIDRSQLNFPNSFKNFSESMKTLFQIFTNDHWLAILEDLAKVTGNEQWAGVYVCVWLVLATYLINNIFIGIMVSSFQTIKEGIETEIEEEEEEKKLEGIRRFTNALDRDYQRKTHNFDAHPSKVDQDVIRGSGPQFGAAAVEATADDWKKMVDENLQTLAHEETNFCWPRDSLLRYYTILESLQENLAERQELLRMSAQTIMGINDSPIYIS